MVQKSTPPKEQPKEPEIAMADFIEEPILTSLAAQMHVDLVVNEEGHIWVLHDQIIPGILNWAEYHTETNKLYFLSQKGQMQELGMVIPKKMIPILSQASQITLFRIENKAIKDFYLLPLIVQE